MTASGNIEEIDTQTIEVCNRLVRFVEGNNLKIMNIILKE